MAVQDWSPTEINQAKEHFLSGLKIKDIADKLGRTPSSTNKALSRFGIRNNAPRYNSPKTPKLLPKDNVKIKLPAPKFDRNSLRKQLDNWVSFWKV